MTQAKRKLSFDELAALHVGDLFGAHRARRPIKPMMKQKRKEAIRKPDLPPTKIPPPKHFIPIECPCCKRKTSAPALDIVVDHYRIPPAEERILRAVWQGKGRPVQTERIFSTMYADDPDGGPAPGRMYAAFKAGLHNIRCRLVGSGITIESVGYRQGYRIVIAGEK